MSNVWLRIAFDGGISHAVHARLLAPLIADMAARGMQVENYETKYGAEHARSLKGNPAPITEWAFDLGGPCYTTMPRETLVVDGLSIDIDCDHFNAVLMTVDGAKIRRFDSGEWYYKLKFWHHATVLTVEQRDALFDQMLGRVGHAEHRAKAFWDERKAKTAHSPAIAKGKEGER